MKYKINSVIFNAFLILIMILSIDLIEYKNYVDANKVYHINHKKEYISFMDENDPFFVNARKYARLEGFEVVYCHANEHAFFPYGEDSMGAEEFAEKLLNTPEYHGGDIWLLSCSAGKYLLASKLAKNLQVNVLAPSGCLRTIGQYIIITETEENAREFYLSKQCEINANRTNNIKESGYCAVRAMEQLSGQWLLFDKRGMVDLNGSRFFQEKLVR